VRALETVLKRNPRIRARSTCTSTRDGASTNPEKALPTPSGFAR
jgi:hypothetical protein